MITISKNAKYNMGIRNRRKLRGLGLWLVLMAILALGLAACSSDKETESTTVTAPVITANPASSTDITIAPDRYLPDVPRISAKELKSKLQTGSNVLVIDTRSLEQFDEFRLAGAIFMPVAQLSHNFDEMRKYDEVVAYCT